jgi:hypothetical protein
MTSHDVVRDVFTSIVRDARFHVLREQTHVLSPFALQSSRHQIDILLSIDGVCTLVDVVIVDHI